MLICVFTGFTSGLPLYVLVSLIPAWLRVEHVSLAEIGALSLVQLPYTWKFLWSPAMDRYQLPFLGLRRGWMLLTQIVLLLVIVQFGVLSPGGHPMWMVTLLAAAVALFSATQDIQLDAYRRELLADNELGLGNAIHVNAYRVAGLVPGALSLWLATYLPWSLVFLITACFMLVGILLTLCIKERSMPDHPRTLRDAVVLPFQEFFTRHGLKSALLALVFMVLYKLGDNMATALSTPFYLDMGFSLREIALVAKNATLWPAIIGTMLGGLWMVKLGINRSLWVFGAVQAVTILGFYLLSLVGSNLYVLALVLCLEYLGVGMGTAALVAYIASISHPRFVATQFALLTALAAIPRLGASATSGVIVDAIGWSHFFLLCFLLAIPGLVILHWAAPWHRESSHVGSESMPEK
jgi:PAT family beta-lactamase induction signal transducer AmpG